MGSQTDQMVARVADTTANPAPLGLMGFGMTTVLLNIHNAGFYELGSMILAMGVFYGGLAQILAGIMEWKKGNTFGTTAFTSYGFFWLSLVALILMPGHGLGEATSKPAMALVLLRLGRIHPRPVHRHAETESRPAGHLPQPERALLPAHVAGRHREPDDRSAGRLGRHRVRALGSLRGAGAGAQRGLRARRAAARARPQRVGACRREDEPWLTCQRRCPSGC